MKNLILRRCHQILKGTTLTVLPMFLISCSGFKSSVIDLENSKGAKQLSSSNPCSAFPNVEVTGNRNVSGQLIGLNVNASTLQLCKSDDRIKALLTNFYFGILLRQPDPGGLAYYTSLAVKARDQGSESQCASEMSQIAKTIWTSAEHTNLTAQVPTNLKAYLYTPAPDRSINPIVNPKALFQFYQLYAGVLGRQPDMGGLSWWYNANGGNDIASTAQDFIASAEFTNLAKSACARDVTNPAEDGAGTGGDESGPVACIVDGCDPSSSGSRTCSANELMTCTMTSNNCYGWSLIEACQYGCDGNACKTQPAPSPSPTPQPTPSPEPVAPYCARGMQTRCVYHSIYGDMEVVALRTRTIITTQPLPIAYSEHTPCPLDQNGNPLPGNETCAGGWDCDVVIDTVLPNRYCGLPEE